MQRWRVTISGNMTEFIPTVIPELIPQAPSFADQGLPESDDCVIFEEESSGGASGPITESWCVLVVDDDPEVHTATRFALSSIIILDRPLRLLHAYSAETARTLLSKESKVAVVLLDVVMESNDAGLTLVRAIRDELILLDVRIILRTGQPGYAPELEVIGRYDINDYKTKAELTHARLITALTAAIRGYRQIVALNESRRGLEMIIQASADLLTRRGIGHFAEGILTQIAALLSVESDGLICVEDNVAGEIPRVVAAAGSYKKSVGCELDQLQDKSISAVLRQAFEQSNNVFEERCSVFFFGSKQGQRLAAYVSTCRSLEQHEKDLLRIYCQNIALAKDNLNLIDRLHQLAYIDPLSQLPNRAAFIESIENVIAAGVCEDIVVIVDVDHFAATAETIGYQDANRLLLQIGRRLREQLPDCMEIARVSGDAFGILGPAGGLAAGRFAEVFEDPIDLGGLALTVGVTSGRIALSGHGKSRGEDIIRSAHLALKRAKEQRRGSDQEFTPALAEGLRQRSNLMQDLRRAIRDREFFLVYQPQVDLLSGRTVGVEALIRWKPNDGDYVSPDRFIDIAENSGLIIPIGDFVMRKACQQLVALREAGNTALRMAVNVSVAQWLDRGFPDMVESILKEHGLPPHTLELEITESVAMQGAGPVREVMLRLRELGLQMALDDFGTGFSSLSYLQLLPLHRLKIDRAFIGGMDKSKPNQILAETVVRLGQNLDLRVIAEGVETEAQAELLRHFGCHEAQGFHYARPMAGHELLEWLGQHQ